MLLQSRASEARPLSTGLNVFLVLPGSTDLDAQRRISGSLDIPLNHFGTEQARRCAAELSTVDFEAIWCSPCLAARQTAEIFARPALRVRVADELRNLDHGLWHGKRIAEIRQSQPRVFRQWQEHPESVCPPRGESIDEARHRIRRWLDRIRRKYRRGSIALVIAEPAASIVRQELRGSAGLGDLWQAECCCGRWEQIAPNGSPPDASGL
jgi:broad specificity phosphatase PhoE